MSLIAIRTLPKLKTLNRSYATGMRLYEKLKGDRDQVGWGNNGLPVYKDVIGIPFPAIRYLPNTPDVLALREREKEDWKTLTLEEKKQLYRNSFRHTFAEITAPKAVLGGFDIPPDLTEDAHKLYVKRFLDEEKDPIWGISSMWDYEKKEWKK